MRQALRGVLDGKTCVRPASVFDPLTIRIAGEMGFEAAMLGGSVAALAVLGAPDHTLLTLDEFAGLCRRLCRVGSVPLIADADHGFGNALNVMRCVQELESAGVAALSIEDTVLPRVYGSAKTTLISIAEAKGKLAAAIAARRDPLLVIAGRTDARLQDDAELAERATVFAGEGVDVIFLAGCRRVAQVDLVREASGLPVMLAGAKEELATADLASLGIRICLQGHKTLPAAMNAAWDSLSRDDGAQVQKRPTNLMRHLSEADAYDDLINQYLLPKE